MKSRIVASLLLVQLPFVSSCEKAYEQQQEIADLSRVQVVVLKKRPSQKKIHYLRIEASGHTRSVLTLELVIDGIVIERRVVSGPFRTTIYTDWYDNEAQIRLSPGDVVQGDCLLRYSFDEPKKA